MADDDEPRRRRDEPPPIEFIRPGEPQVPAPSHERPSAWVTRPEDFDRAATALEGPKRRPIAGMSAIAGACLILSGLVGMASNFLILTAPLTPEEIQNLTNLSAAEQAAGVVGALFLLYIQPVSILGGIMAFQKKNWKLVVACAILSMLNFGFVFLGTALGLIGLLVVLRSRPEFAS